MKQVKQLNSGFPFFSTHANWQIWGLLSMAMDDAIDGSAMANRRKYRKPLRLSGILSFLNEVLWMNSNLFSWRQGNSRAFSITSKQSLLNFGWSFIRKILDGWVPPQNTQTQNTQAQNTQCPKIPNVPKYPRPKYPRLKQQYQLNN